MYKSMNHLHRCLITHMQLLQQSTNASEKKKYERNCALFRTPLSAPRLSPCWNLFRKFPQSYRPSFQPLMKNDNSRASSTLTKQSWNERIGACHVSCIDLITRLRERCVFVSEYQFLMQKGNKIDRRSVHRVYAGECNVYIRAVKSAWELRHVAVKIQTLRVPRTQRETASWALNKLWLCSAVMWGSGE